MNEPENTTECPVCEGRGYTDAPGTPTCFQCTGYGRVLGYDPDPPKSPANVMQGPLEKAEEIVACGQCDWFGDFAVCRIDEDGDQRCPSCGAPEIAPVMMGKTVLDGHFVQKNPKEIMDHLLKMPLEVEEKKSNLTGFSDCDIVSSFYGHYLIQEEVVKAQSKFPDWPTDPMHAVGILGEEYGEVLKDCLQLTYEPHKTTKDKLRQEVIQLAAMCHRFLMSMDRYEFKPSAQHAQ